MKNLLDDARREIIRLRRDNEILHAKVEVMDLFACVLHTQAANRSEGAAPDVAWALQQAIDELSEKQMAELDKAMLEPTPTGPVSVRTSGLPS